MEHDQVILMLSIINTIGLLVIGGMKAIKKLSCRNKCFSCVYEGGTNEDVSDAVEHAIRKLRIGELEENDIKKIEFAHAATRRRGFTV